MALRLVWNSSWPACLFCSRRLACKLSCRIGIMNAKVLTMPVGAAVRRSTHGFLSPFKPFSYLPSNPRSWSLPKGSGRAPIWTFVGSEYAYSRGFSMMRLEMP